ncbi:MAG: hypothetical protein EXR71_02025 [Myxococcales bacterium]|nr:hypothetical protein [Myxococcales bacterium]
MPVFSRTIPPAYAAWLAEVGTAGLRHAVAEAVGDADARWRHTGLVLFDPAFRKGPTLPPVAEPGALYAAMHPLARANGVYYTPRLVADGVVDLAWDGDGPVSDPACGAGAFLLAALRRVPASRRADFARTSLFGADIDALAVMIAQACITIDAGLDRSGADALSRNVTARNSLTEPPAPVRTILTNPPFLNRLRSLTAPTVGLAAALRSRHGGALGPYTDVSVVFLLDALRAAERIGIVLPASVGATRDAAAARALAGRPTFAWTLPPGSFPGVGVPLLALGFGPGVGSTTRRFSGVPARAEAAVSGDWCELLVSDRAPPWSPPDGQRRLGDVATIEADFRDEYYALRGQVREGGDGVRIVTSGGISSGRFRWGERPARIHKSSWLRPTVDACHLHPRQAARVGPRLFVATQTRVLEAAADPAGAYVGLTPVLTVLPGTWAIAELLAVLLSPPASAWARRRSVGAGLTLSVLKLSAAQLRDLPLPPSIPGGAVVLAERLIGGDASCLDELATVMTQAYGAPDEVLAWWRRESRRA